MTVLLRYGDLDAARTVLRGLDIGQSVLPGYAFGMCGIADALLDAAAITVFLFEPAERFAHTTPGRHCPAGRTR